MRVRGQRLQARERLVGCHAGNRLFVRFPRHRPRPFWLAGNFGLSGVYPHLRDMVEKALRLAFDTPRPHGPAVQTESANPAKTTASVPDFRGVDTWVFDLDHTLYTTSA